MRSDRHDGSSDACPALLISLVLRRCRLVSLLYSDCSLYSLSLVVVFYSNEGVLKFGKYTNISKPNTDTNHDN